MFKLTQSMHIAGSLIGRKLVCLSKELWGLRVLVHAYDPSIWDDAARDSWVSGQSELHSTTLSPKSKGANSSRVRSGMMFPPESNCKTDKDSLDDKDSHSAQSLPIPLLYCCFPRIAVSVLEFLKMSLLRREEHTHTHIFPRC